MSRRLPGTPRSKVRNALRQLFLRSRERAACIKSAKYTCSQCGAKQSRVKGKEVYVEIHHLDGIFWEKLIDMVYETLLCHPDKMRCLCVDCHKHQKEQEVQ